MNLATVMTELGAAASTITGLRVLPWAAAKASPPALLFGLPDDMQPVSTYGTGLATIRGLPAILLVGKASVRTSLTALSAYTAGGGAKSLTAAWAGYGGYSHVQVLDVKRIVTDAVKLAGVEYLGAIFYLDVTGPGNL